MMCIERQAASTLAVLPCSKQSWSSSLSVHMAVKGLKERMNNLHFNTLFKSNMHFIFFWSLYTLTIVDAHIKLGLSFKQLHNRSGYGDTVVSTVTSKQEGCGFEFTSWAPWTFLDGHGLWEELVILNC